MATAVFFHAHPDDEAIATAGVMIGGADMGHRIVLVCATDGAVGEADDEHIPEGASLADVRALELADAAVVLGVHRLEFLGYRDSGMVDTDTNRHPDAFWAADVEVAAMRLAVLLREERADLLTVYDEFGNYGHPDHIQVHRVGVRAAELAGVDHVFEATMNRDEMRALADDPAFESLEIDEGELERERDEIRDTEMGTPAGLITHAIDVGPVIDRKREAMIAHKSQITPESFFLQLPDDAFTRAFGTEWFVRRHSSRTGEPFETDFYAGLTLDGGERE